MCPNDDTFSTLWFLFWKAANLQLVLTKMSTGDLTGFVQSKVNHTEALSGTFGDAWKIILSSDRPSATRHNCWSCSSAWSIKSIVLWNCFLEVKLVTVFSPKINAFIFVWFNFPPKRTSIMAQECWFATKLIFYLKSHNTLKQFISLKCHPSVFLFSLKSTPVVPFYCDPRCTFISQYTCPRPPL